MEELFKEIAGTLVYGLWILIGVAVQQITQWLRTRIAHKKLVAKVDTIVTQVTPNGGTSIGDRVDKVIRGQEAHFAVMLNLSSEPLFRADKDGLWTSCNHKLTDIFGMYQRDMLGRGWEIAIGNSTKERDEFVKAWEEFIKNQRPLNHRAEVMNQETNKSQLYLFTARQIVEDGEFQFFLGKVSELAGGNLT